MTLLAKLSVLAALVVLSAPPAAPASSQRGDLSGLGGRGTDPFALPAEPRFAELPDEDGWRALLAREQRISFTPRTTGEARAVLESSGATPEKRAIAMVALGAAGTLAERDRLLRMAREGEDLQRRAAILALGEMGAATSAELEEWVRSSAAPQAECALLALLRGGRRADRRRVEEIAADPTQALASSASELLLFQYSPGASRPSRAAVLLLRLRYEAARRHGLVDGENWRVATIRSLASDPEFARDVVLTASSRLRTPAVRDHVFAVLQRESGRARLHAAVSALPDELSELVENDLWRPRDTSDWRALLDEIDQARLERLTLPVIRAAFDVPEVRYRAVNLASLAGDEDLSPLIGLDTTKLSVEDREQVCLAIGARSDAGWLERFALLGEDADARVRLSYLVARFRQRQRNAIETVETTVADVEAPGHAELMDALCAAVHDPAVAILLEDRFLDAPDAEKTRIAAVLCLEGRLVGRARVRSALAVEPPPTGSEAEQLVRALRRNSTAEDIGVLRSLFPSDPPDRGVDRELALALLDRSEPDVLPIVRAALWARDFDVSVLAGGVLAQANGIRALVDELRVPPEEASSGDLRRVGFGIGVWGGIQAVQSLARELRWASGHPALQGALLGAMSTRTQ